MIELCGRDIEPKRRFERRKRVDPREGLSVWATDRFRRDLPPYDRTNSRECTSRWTFVKTAKFSFVGGQVNTFEHWRGRS